MKQFKKLFLFIFTVFILTGCSASAKPDSPELEGVIFKIGKADSILLATKNHTILIDTGEKEDGGEVSEYLKDVGRNTVDLLILTHYDKDHVGGAADIIKNINVLRVLEPGYEKSSAEYDSYKSAANAAGTEREYLKSGSKTFSFDGVSFEISAPEKSEYENENDLSLVVSAAINDQYLLFAGDAMDERLSELPDTDNCTFLKVPHHGVYTEGTVNFIERISPKYAAITCSDKNPPDVRILEALKSVGADTMLTKDGNIYITCDPSGFSMFR